MATVTTLRGVDAQEVRDFVAEFKQQNAELVKAYALLKLAYAVGTLATHVKYLGNGDAGTSMGAIEAMSVELRKGLAEVASAVSDLSSSVGQLDFCPAE